MLKLVPAFLLLAPLVFARTAFAQTAQVTFYASGSQAKLLLPKSEDAAFVGWIYDGPQKLTLLAPGRFGTFTLPAGVHSFSASFSKHPAANSQLVLTLEPEHSYFVAVTAYQVNTIVTPIGWHHGILAETDCATAQEHAGRQKPVKSRWVDKAVASTHSPSAQLPACTPSD